MKVKIFSDTNTNKLEKMVNEFISSPNISVSDVKIAGAGFALWPIFTVMVTYDETL